MQTIYTGVKNGKLVDQERFDEYLKRYEAKPLKIILDHPSKRSLEQNSYYWGVVLKMLSEHINYSVDETHEICKYKFLGYDLKEINNEAIPIMKTTRDLSTVDFMGYLEEIKQWAATLGVVIPDPNQTEFLED